ncbi:MAG: YedE-related selenium metabolism membrane protein [Chloroflexi bacterium]|nr:YedE-related selenium metabolism membrane protein [Chloroflexota bacterium]
MRRLSRSLSPRLLLIVSGLIFGALASLLVRWGNPDNMGFCAACFLRDITGALGLHRAEPAQYIRPELLGLVLGSFIAAFSFREFRTRGGSSPLVRFLLGALMMTGALVFLGCPARALLRLAGGDLNGITALTGLVSGAFLGIVLLRRGFNLGRSAAMPAPAGWLAPSFTVILLLFAIFTPFFIFSSVAGPGSLHPALWVSLIVGLAVGLLAQRTRMCFVGGWRDVVLIRDFHLFSIIAAFFVGALVTNFALGQVGHWGFSDQPIAHDEHLWNFFSMALVGLAATLLGGCPLRQMVLSGQGDTDAAVTVLGMMAGAAASHNFGLAASAKGVTTFGAWAVGLGLAMALAVGLLMKERRQT